MMIPVDTGSADSSVHSSTNDNNRVPVVIVAIISVAIGFFFFTMGPIMIDVIVDAYHHWQRILK